MPPTSEAIAKEMKAEARPELARPRSRRPRSRRRRRACHGGARRWKPRSPPRSRSRAEAKPAAVEEHKEAKASAAEEPKAPVMEAEPAPVPKHQACRRGAETAACRGSAEEDGGCADAGCEACRLRRRRHPARQRGPAPDILLCRADAGGVVPPRRYGLADLRLHKAVRPRSDPRQGRRDHRRGHPPAAGQGAGDPHPPQPPADALADQRRARERRKLDADSSPTRCRRRRSRSR